MKEITLAEYLYWKVESLASFAERTGVLRATLSQIKNGHTRPRLDIAQAILRACNEDRPITGCRVTIESLLKPWNDAHASDDASSGA